MYLVREMPGGVSTKQSAIYPAFHVSWSHNRVITDIVRPLIESSRITGREDDQVTYQ